MANSLNGSQFSKLELSSGLPHVSKRRTSTSQETPCHSCDPKRCRLERSNSFSAYSDISQTETYFVTRNKCIDNGNQNPVSDGKLLPDGVSEGHVREDKVWIEEKNSDNYIRELAKGTRSSGAVKPAGYHVGNRPKESQSADRRLSSLPPLGCEINVNRFIRRANESALFPSTDSIDAEKGQTEHFTESLSEICEDSTITRWKPNCVEYVSSTSFTDEEEQESDRSDTNALLKNAIRNSYKSFCIEIDSTKRCQYTDIQQKPVKLDGLEQTKNILGVDPSLSQPDMDTEDAKIPQDQLEQENFKRVQVIQEERKNGAESRTNASRDKDNLNEYDRGENVDTSMKINILRVMSLGDTSVKVTTVSDKTSSKEPDNGSNGTLNEDMDKNCFKSDEPLDLTVTSSPLDLTIKANREGDLSVSSQFQGESEQDQVTPHSNELPVESLEKTCFQRSSSLASSNYSNSTSAQPATVTGGLTGSQFTKENTDRQQQVSEQYERVTQQHQLVAEKHQKVFQQQKPVSDHEVSGLLHWEALSQRHKGLPPEQEAPPGGCDTNSVCPLPPEHGNVGSGRTVACFAEPSSYGCISAASNRHSWSRYTNGKNTVKEQLQSTHQLQASNCNQMGQFVLNERELGSIEQGLISLYNGNENAIRQFGPSTHAMGCANMTMNMNGPVPYPTSHTSAPSSSLSFVPSAKDQLAKCNTILHGRPHIHQDGVLGESIRVGNSACHGHPGYSCNVCGVSSSISSHAFLGQSFPGGFPLRYGQAASQSNMAKPTDNTMTSSYWGQTVPPSGEFVPRDQYVRRQQLRSQTMFGMNEILAARPPQPMQPPLPHGAPQQQLPPQQAAPLLQPLLTSQPLQPPRQTLKPVIAPPCHTSHHQQRHVPRHLCNSIVGQQTLSQEMLSQHSRPNMASRDNPYSQNVRPLEMVGNHDQLKTRIAHLFYSFIG